MTLPSPAFPISRHTGTTRGVAARRAEIDGAVGLMHVLNDLSVLLTTLPAGTEVGRAVARGGGGAVNRIIFTIGLS